MNYSQQIFRVADERPVSLTLSRVTLKANLGMPVDPSGIVLFAHGSGSSRHSPRNVQVANVLQKRGIATLLMDLLTEREEEIDERTSQLRFNIFLLARRLAGATGWTMRRPELCHLRVGYFGASTGAAAALVAASHIPQIAAIVSRGGRPDLAGEALASLAAPTLLIVGGNDEPVIYLNEHALEKLGCAEKKMIIVPGATHLFEEPGALEEVARLAADWFSSHFTVKAHGRPERGAGARQSEASRFGRDTSPI